MEYGGDRFWHRSRCGDGGNAEGTDNNNKSCELRKWIGSGSQFLAEFRRQKQNGLVDRVTMRVYYESSRENSVYICGERERTGAGGQNWENWGC